MKDKLTLYKELCERGLSRKEISNQMGVTTRTIYDWQTKTGIGPYGYQERLKRYIELCEKGKTRKEISEILGVENRTLTDYKNRTGYKPKSAIKKPSLNPSFFKEINSEEKAYILGFAFADGYIEGNERSLTFKIHEKDTDVLQKIKKYTSCTNKIHKVTGTNMVVLYLSSVELVKDLRNYGMVRSKTFTLDFPELSAELYNHFIRGFCDGDGHIGKRQTIFVNGAEKLMKNMCIFLEEKFERKIYLKKTDNCYRLVLSQRDKDIVNWLYDDATIYMNRKHNSFVNYWQYMPKGEEVEDKKPLR